MYTSAMCERCGYATSIHIARMHDNSESEWGIIYMTVNMGFFILRPIINSFESFGMIPAVTSRGYLYFEK